MCAHLSVISQLLPHASRLRLQQRMRVVSVLVVLADDAHECAAALAPLEQTHKLDRVRGVGGASQLFARFVFQGDSSA